MISFKVYLTRENIPGKFGREIRRFESEPNVAASFFTWNQRVKSLFHGVDWSHSRISWRDSEGDDIAISSTNEFTLALKEMSTHAVCKFYLVEFDPSESVRAKNERCT